MQTDREFSYRTVLLEALQVYVSTRFSEPFLSTIKLEQAVEIVGRDLVYYLHGHVYTERLGSRTFKDTRYTYSSWWQHTKAVHFPTFSKWLRRPARQTPVELAVTVDLRASFPDLPYTPPESWGRVVRLAIPDKPWLEQ